MNRRLPLAALLIPACFSIGLSAAENITLPIPGGSVRGEVVKVTKSEVVIKTSDGKQQSVPALLLKPKDYFTCWLQVLTDKDAKGHFDLGEYCLKQGMKAEAEEALRSAARIDPTGYREKVDALLGAATAGQVKVAEPPKPVEAVDPKNPKVAEAKDPKKEASPGEGAEEGDGGWITIVGKDGKKRQVLMRGANKPTKAKTEEEVKKFNTERLAELNKVLGGNFQMTETAHYYCFSNLPMVNAKVPELSHKYFEQKNEELYKLLAMVMQHKEGDPLWFNKCPIYYFQKRRQFQEFAVNIDHCPSGANSGGYFAPNGREVHIAIPMTDFLPPNQQVREATNTLYHEGTHAFLQLVGNDVDINRWLHEGMAQFIEFFYDPKNNSGRNDRVSRLRDLVRMGDLLTWEQGRDRPMGGMDTDGYAFGWSRVHFLYNCFPDKSMLPKMIRMIKDGKPEEEAIEKVYGKKSAELEKVWEQWMQSASRTNFNQ